VNDVDRLREAMSQPPGEHFAEVDVEHVMRVGGRRRARRRLLTGAGAVLAVLVVAGSVFGVQIYKDSQASVTVAAPRTAMVDAAPVGPVIDTGVVDPNGEAVLYFVTVGSGRYQLVLAHKADDGKLTPALTADGPPGGDGFHSVTTGHPRSFVPLFGYFAGPVQHFKAMYQGDPLPVQGRRVSELNVTVFWATPKYDAEDISGSSVVQLSAFDTQGNLLESGRGPG
jgi:hypothetical protein